MIDLLKAPLKGGLSRSVLLCCCLIGSSLLPRSISWGCDEGMAASVTMENSLRILRSEREALGIVASPDLDPYGIGIIGEEFTPLTTTLGHLEDKIASANPLFAAALVGEFRRMGLKRGDSVAIGASGSFPGLLVAVLSACDAMELRPLLICSLGSSMYGANRVGFNVVDMVKLLEDRGSLDFEFLGFSLGGDDDRYDAPLFPEWRGLTLDEALRLASEERFIHEDSLGKSVEVRMSLYDEASGGEIGCFVGVGGASVTFGDSDQSASFPGGTTSKPFESMPSEGLLSRFLRSGIPVIHLLCVRDLCDRWSIPYGDNPLNWRNHRFSRR